MRLRNRLLKQRLERVRDRARSARHLLTTMQSKPAERPPLPELRRCYADAVCGTWADAEPGRRSAARVPVASEVLLRRLGSFGFQVKLRDVSAGGCQLEWVEQVELHDHMVARLPGLEPFGAKVRWIDSRAAGLSFDRAMHPAVFEMLLERLA